VLTRYIQHGQEILDSLAEIKVSIMTRYEQWRANPSSLQSQAPVSNPAPQPLVAHRSINSHGTNTPSSSSTPSSSRSRASIPPRSRIPSPYDQSPPEDDRARRERVDALLREEPRRGEEVYPADGARAEQWHAREDDTRRRREWEEEGRRRTTDQRRQEQDGILRRQREAEHAAQSARLGQSTGQHQVVSSVQYPAIAAPASSGPITGYLQMPLESPTRCVNPLRGTLLCMPCWYLKHLNVGLVQKSLIKRETLLLAILD
jgi:STAM-binding protein